MPAIEVCGLTKRFGQVLAVDRVSFRVEAGTVTGFLGPNGAGKTTTLRMLLGLVRPDAGEARICGRRYRDLDQPLRRAGAVLDAAIPHPGRTARAHLRIVAMAARANPSRVEEVLELTGLAAAANRRARHLSLGLRQRLGLAAALVAEPEVLILDEPANGLDPDGVRWLRSLLRQRAEAGAAVLVSSHLLAEVAQTVDSVVILDHGRLVAESSLTGLAAGAGPVVRVRTPRPGDLAAAVTGDGGQARLTGDGYLLITGSTPERVAVLAAGRAIPVVESTVAAPSLEEVFMRLTGHPAPSQQPGGAAGEVGRRPATGEVAG